MERRYQLMKLAKFTIDDIKKEEITWKELVSYDEMRHLRRFKKEGYHLAYEKAQLNAWIIKTLVEKKQRYKFKSCKSIVLVGSGIYPYSMFDLHRQYPHIKQVGLEIESNRALISRRLIDASPAKNMIKIITIDGIDFDYSWMTDEDFVFLSVDVNNNKKIYNKILKTSKAQPLVCAPYKDSWIRNLATYFSEF